MLALSEQVSGTLSHEDKMQHRIRGVNFQSGGEGFAEKNRRQLWELGVLST